MADCLWVQEKACFSYICPSQNASTPPANFAPLTLSEGPSPMLKVIYRDIFFVNIYNEIRGGGTEHFFKGGKVEKVRRE